MAREQRGQQQPTFSLVVSRIGGEHRAGTIGQPIELAVQTTNERDGKGASGVDVRFEVSPEHAGTFGTGSDFYAIARTDDTGVAKTHYVPKDPSGVVKVIVSAKEGPQFTVATTQEVLPTGATTLVAPAPVGATMPVIPAPAGANDTPGFVEFDGFR